MDFNSINHSDFKEVEKGCFYGFFGDKKNISSSTQGSFPYIFVITCNGQIIAYSIGGTKYKKGLLDNDCEKYFIQKNKK